MEMSFVLFCVTLMEIMTHVAAAAEPGVIESLILAAYKRPWLWGLYVFTVGLPVILFISFMWPDKRFGPPDQPYYYKKSDDVQPDDPELSPLTKTTDIKEGKSEGNAAKKRTMKSDLDSKVQ